MAKANAKVATVAPVEESVTPTTTGTGLVALMTPRTVFEDHGLELNVANVTPDIVAFILDYGFGKIMQDAAAGATELGRKTMAATKDHTLNDEARAAADKAYDTLCDKAGLDADECLNMAPEAFGLAYAQGLRKAKLQRLVDGTITTRLGSSGPRAITTRDKITKQVTATMFKVALDKQNAMRRAKGVAILAPSKENLATLLANYSVKYAADISAEVDRQLAVMESPLELDESDFTL